MYDLGCVTVWLISILPAQEPEAENQTFRATEWVQDQPRQLIETLTQKLQRELGTELSNRALAWHAHSPGGRLKWTRMQIPNHLQTQ